MISLLQRLGALADKALSVVIWLHDSIMLFICLFWLLPLIALVESRALQELAASG